MGCNIKDSWHSSYDPQKDTKKINISQIMKLAKDETAKLVAKTDVSNFRRNFKKYFLFFKVKMIKLLI